MKAPITTSGNAKHGFTSPTRIDGVVAVGGKNLSSRLRRNTNGNKRFTEGCQPSQKPTKRHEVVKKLLMVGCMFSF